MANVDIENPGASENSLKSALAVLGMPALVASGDLVGQYVDVLLPGTYDFYFYLLMPVGLSSAEAGGIGAVLSLDGGVNWIYDAVGYTYQSDHIMHLFDASLPSDAAGYFNAVFGVLHPGNADVLPMIASFGGSALSGRSVEVDGMNSDASDPPPPASPTYTRYNAIRIMPFGNANNPPTSGHTFTTGKYYFFGVGG